MNNTPSHLSENLYEYKYFSKPYKQATFQENNCHKENIDHYPLFRKEIMKSKQANNGHPIIQNPSLDVTEF